MHLPCQRVFLLACLTTVATWAVACSSDSPQPNPEATEASLVTAAELAQSSPLVVYEAREARNSEQADVYLLDPGDGRRARLTDGNSFNVGPAWSPDEQTIIFASTRDGQEKTDVYTMARDGSNVRRITDTPDYGEYEPRFSPDGQSIAYVRENGEGAVLSLMDIGGNATKDLTPPQRFIEFPTWDPDGSRVAFAGIPAGGEGSPDIYAVPSIGGAIEVVVATDSADVCPHFTRDGSNCFMRP